MKQTKNQNRRNIDEMLDMMTADEVETVLGFILAMMRKKMKQEPIVPAQTRK